MKLLQTLFQRFTTKGVHDWNVRGKVRHSHMLIDDLTDCLSVHQVFIDYANAMTRLPELREFHRADAVQDASHAVELEELSRSIPKLLAILPDVLPDRTDVRHKVAISEMIAGLTLRLDQLRPLSVRVFPSGHRQ